MLCRKCKTSLAYKQKKCGYCGVRQWNTNILSMLIAAVLVTGSLFYLFAVPSIAESEIASAPPENEQPVMPSATEEPVSNVPDKPEAGSNKKTEKEIKEILKNVLNGAITYYDRYSDYRPFVTRNGYLYDMTSKSYIKPNDLYYSGTLNNDYTNEPVYILYMKPKDMPNGIDDATLKIYAAYEADEGFYVISRNETDYLIIREDFKALIESYDYLHGEVTRPDENDEDYAGIIEAVKTYGFISNTLDVRYMAKDDRYASAAVSYGYDPGIIYEYILEKTDGAWSVVIPNFETYSSFCVKINEIIVNLNLDILPEFDILGFAGQHRYDFEQINALLTAVKFLEEDEKLVFEAGTTDFVYQEYSTGRRLIFALAENKSGWRKFEASSWQEAESVIKELSKNSPTFLIRQKN